MPTTQHRTIIRTETPGWFLDPETGKKTRENKGVDRVVSQAEWDEQVAKAAGQDGHGRTTVLDTGKFTHGPTTTINCIECGAERVVQVQDAKQVKRCVFHQKEHRKRLRREKLAAKRRAAKAAA
jgi:hypothetical protein